MSKNDYHKLIELEFHEETEVSSEEYYITVKRVMGGYLYIIKTFHGEGGNQTALTSQFVSDGTTGKQ